MNAKKPTIIAAVIAAAASIGMYANVANAQIDPPDWATPDGWEAEWLCFGYASQKTCTLQNPWFNTDEVNIKLPESEVAIIGDDCPLFALCNVDGTMIKSPEEQVAEGGPGAWICSVAGCSEDPVGTEMLKAELEQVADVGCIFNDDCKEDPMEFLWDADADTTNAFKSDIAACVFNSQCNGLYGEDASVVQGIGGAQLSNIDEADDGGAIVE